MLIGPPRRSGLLPLVFAAGLLVSCDQTPEPGVEELEASPTELTGGCPDLSAAKGPPVPVTMRDTFFDPSCLVVSSTQAITLTNAGNVDHNFTVQGTDLSVDVAPGEEVETEEVGTLVGARTHRVFCRFYENQGMVGSIVVE